MRRPLQSSPMRAKIAGSRRSPASVARRMVGLAYASVPLYSMFCQVTGFGGTTQRADAAPETATGKFITIRFDANTAGSLAWNFHPVQSRHEGQDRRAEHGLLQRHQHLRQACRPAAPCST